MPVFMNEAHILEMWTHTKFFTYECHTLLDYTPVNTYCGQSSIFRYNEVKSYLHKQFIRRTSHFYTWLTAGFPSVSHLWERKSFTLIQDGWRSTCCVSMNSVLSTISCVQERSVLKCCCHLLALWLSNFRKKLCIRLQSRWCKMQASSAGSFFDPE